MSAEHFDLIVIDHPHVGQVTIDGPFDAVPATADDLAWLMHRSCSLGLPAPRTIAASTATRWDTEDLAAFTDGVDMFQEPYAPTVRVVGRIRSQTVARNVAYMSRVQSMLNYSRKLVALGRLTAGIAHEVKNPLNAMTIHLELLKQKVGSIKEPIMVPATSMVASNQPSSR